MEILIKDLENDTSIMYLITETGNNVKAEIVANYLEEKNVLSKWVMEHDVFKIVDKRTNDVKYIKGDDNVNPLILVFYLDKGLMSNKDIIVPFTESVNNLLSDRKINAVAFFLPTETNERIECINPVTIPENEMVRVNKILKDLEKTYSLDK